MMTRLKRPLSPTAVFVAALVLLALVSIAAAVLT